MMRVLIVEDQDGVARILARFYAQIATAVRVSRDLPTTMHMLAMESFDLISLDLVLRGPAKLTIDAIPRMKQLNPDALIVIVTGLATKEEEEQAIKMGVDGFMTKMAVMESQGKFLSALRRIFHTITQKPTRYEKNIELLEMVVERLAAFEPPAK